MTKSNYINTDEIRARFSSAMSKMYRKEVPAYGTLLELVSDVNKDVLNRDKELKDALCHTDNLERISEERHGAIRLGTAKELRMMARIFAVMGMQPVSYYDLTQANVPVHSTAFRAIDTKSLARSPFRVFCSLLRTELIKDEVLRSKAENILARREIYTANLYRLVEQAETDGGLNEYDTEKFIKEATYTFKWHDDAATDKAFYEALKEADPRAADIVCFKGPHINHLTPRTLDIDTIHADMPNRGMNAKNVVEGPPHSRNILLRQTSFKALTEPVKFNGEDGLHTARFGEIEQRGAALTPKGRKLYDEILSDVRATITPNPDGSNAAEYTKVLEGKFSRFPPTEKEWKEQGLAYFLYYQEGNEVKYTPITYEDFLPVSAAGIFTSNASDKTRQDEFQRSSKSDFEEALGQKVACEFEMYAAMEENSLNAIKS